MAELCRKDAGIVKTGTTSMQEAAAWIYQGDFAVLPAVMPVYNGQLLC